MMTIREAVKWGAKRLSDNNVDNADHDSFELLSAINGMTRTFYLVNGDSMLSEENYLLYEEYIDKRAAHVPLQHILGKAYFYGYEFEVNEDVLIPRPDTEVLVGEVIRITRNGDNILDMCTGSGCILISILKERADAHGTGVDLSDEALKVAVRNARTLEVAEHAEFVQSNLFSEMQNIVYGTEYMKRTAVKDTVKMTECENSNRNYSRAYDMIISNPPYIPTAEIEDLMDEVKLHDPRMALDGMEDGLYFYRAITKQAQDHLVPGGWLLYEIGCSQGEDVAALLRKYKFEDIEIRQDLAGLDRVVLGRKKLQEDKYV